MMKKRKKSAISGMERRSRAHVVLPLIEKLRAGWPTTASAEDTTKRVQTGAEGTDARVNAAVDARDDDAETRAEKDPIEIDMDSDEDDDVMLREILAKKMAQIPWAGRTTETRRRRDRRIGDDANDEREEEEEDDSEVSCRKKKKT